MADETIPDDIMMMAVFVADEFLDDMSHQGAVMAATKALFAERQRCAGIAYRVCAETRHVKLGDKARDAIMSSGGDHG